MAKKLTKAYCTPKGGDLSGPASYERLWLFQKTGGGRSGQFLDQGGEWGALSKGESLSSREKEDRFLLRGKTV